MNNELKLKVLDLYMRAIINYKHKDDLVSKYFDITTGILSPEYLTDKKHISIIKEISKFIPETKEVIKNTTIKELTKIIMDHNLPEIEEYVVDPEKELIILLGIMNIPVHNGITKRQINLAKKLAYNCIPNTEEYPGVEYPKMWQYSNIKPMSRDKVLVLYDREILYGTYNGGTFIGEGKTISWSAIYMWISFESLIFFTKSTLELMNFRKFVFENFIEILGLLKAPKGEISIDQIFKMIKNRLS